MGLLFFIISPLHAQKGKIEGFISDVENKAPLTGGTIVLGGNKGATTDAYGKFYIDAVYPGQYELVVSHVGYETQIIVVEVWGKLLSNVSVAMKKTNLDLAEIRINSKRNSSLHTFGSVDFMLRSINTSQDFLRIVPGLFIAQHTGGGKAEQIFLRGYDSTMRPILTSLSMAFR